MFAGERRQRAWRHGLLLSVKTGEPAFDHVFGMGLFQYLSPNPEEGTLFSDAMASLPSQLLREGRGVTISRGLAPSRISAGETEL